MTERDYWRDHELIRGAVDAATQSFHSHRALHSCAAADRRILDKINRVSQFWRLHTFALETTFFIVLARIFDTSPDAHSVHKLLAITIEHPDFFSKAALCARKRETSRITGANPKWLDDYLQCITWEASASDLRALKKALAPHVRRFESVYRPLRTHVYAHQLLKDEALISDLFSKTLIKEIDEILHFLYDLIQALWQLGYNGKQPALGLIDYGYERRVEEIMASTRGLLDQLS